MKEVKEERADVFESLLNGDLISGVIDKLGEIVDVKTGEASSLSKKLVVEIIFRLNKIYKQSKKTLQVKFREREEIMNYIAHHSRIESGKNFIYQVARRKLRQLMYNEET